MNSEQGEPSATTQDTTNHNSEPRRDEALGGAELIEQEYEEVVKDLNSSAVSFTMPSAEGITMYRGIDGHVNNGKMRELAKAGLRALVEEIEEERAATADNDAASQAASTQAVEGSASEQ